jgi:hypothetical protein
MALPVWYQVKAKVPGCRNLSTGHYLDDCHVHVVSLHYRAPANLQDGSVADLLQSDNLPV